MNLRRFIVQALALLAAAGAHAFSPLDSLGIIVRAPSRAYSFTNKESAFLYGETNGGNTTSWEGFNVFGHEFLDDYVLIIDGRAADRAQAVTTVFPDFLRREYPGGIVEEVHPLDSIAAFFVTVAAPRPVGASFIPLFTGGRAPGDYTTVLSDATILIARSNHPLRTESEDYPAWLAIYAPGFSPMAGSASTGSQFSPAFLAASPSRSHCVTVTVADTRNDAWLLARSSSARRLPLADARRRRMELLLASSRFLTDNRRFDRALAWAKLSLDALIMNQRKKGIFAGLPWFNNYWGRDTFVSLPGAVLVTGRFREARDILRSFADFQQSDSLSTDEGRIPNLVTLTDKAYNTADGTPRFAAMVREFVERSGDARFGLEMYPTIVRAIEGTLRYHVDSLGFLTHGDAETWMDAVGPDGPWSPRGNRANDIQALWAQELDAGEFFAARVGDVLSARRWEEVLGRLRKNFKHAFVRGEGIADRLRPDGTPDMTLRPNQLFTAPLLDAPGLTRMLETVVSKLTYPYGVASLSQDDDNFHPYHIYPQSYPKDASYHNGTVWTWLQGALISQLCACGEENLAFALTDNSVHRILDRGAAGTEAELLDAVARPGEQEPRLSGTFSQAWSLAEFVRNSYDDYIGVRLDRLGKTLTVHPHLPRSLGSASARINADGDGFWISFRRTGETSELSVSSSEFRDTIALHAVIRSSSRESRTVACTLPPRSTLRIVALGGSLLVRRDGKPWPAIISVQQSSLLLPAGLAFAQPRIRPGVRALRGPDYPLLSHELIVSTNPRAATLVDATDPAGDDTGTGRYTYPANPVFAAGSFDIRGFRVACDSIKAYFTLTFRALSDPGWHPEYGFQLTFIAIAIDEDGLPGSGRRLVGRNAAYLLDERHAYEKIIYVGGGIRIEDAAGKVLAAYLPAEGDATHPFADARSATIGFALPLSVLGNPSPGWTFTVLAGAQDDHGGSGLGEFRTVAGIRSEWNGGGRTRNDDPNVYDTLIAHPLR